MIVYFSVHTSPPLLSSPSPSPPNTPDFFHTEWKAHWLQSIQEEKFKIKDFNLKVMKCVMKCRFIAIPGTYKAVLIFLIFFWYGRRNQYPHPMVLNTLQQIAHREKSPDWRSYSQMGLSSLCEFEEEPSSLFLRYRRWGTENVNALLRNTQWNSGRLWVCLLLSHRFIRWPILSS